MTSAIGAVVVLYRPTPDDLDHLVDLRLQCDRVLAIDNSPVEDGALAARLAAHGIGWLFNGNCGGIAGAHNRGLETLFADGLDAVALFDQDSRVGGEFLDRMRESCDALGPEPFAIGPRIYDENDGRFLPELLTGRWTMRLLRLDEGMPPQPCSLLVSSGLVISRRAFEVLGGFDEDMVIDQVDTEYCIRALTQGVQFYVEPSLVLPHHVGTKRWHRVGPLRFISMNHPASRRYYMARNGLHISKRYLRRFPTAAALPNLFTLWQFVQVVLFEPGKRSKLAGLGWGLVDGVTGRLGPLETTRPRLASRLLQE
jgi:rhamnosyltransferase